MVHEKIKIAIIFYLTLLFLNSSQSEKLRKNLRNLEDSTPLNISQYEYPTLDSTTRDGYTVIPIVHTTDIHGHIFPTDMKEEGTDNVLFKYGGIAYFSSYINALQKDWEGKELLYIDSGDLFQGGYESKITKGEVMTSFFQNSDVTQTTLGNHEFDFGEDYLKDKLQKLKNLFITDNVFKSEGENIPLENTVQARIYEYEGIKLGLIGLTTIETISVTAGDLSYIKIIEKYPDIIKAKAEELRGKGAKAIIVISHIGYKCENEDSINPNKLRLTDINSEVECNAYGELYNTIQQLEKGTVDLILGGHEHYNHEYFIDGIPAVLSLNNLDYFDIVYLYFKNGELDKNKTLIEGPIPVCSKVYQKVGRCTEISKSEEKGDLVEFTFHNQPINPDNADEAIKQIITANEALISESEGTVLFKLVESDEIPEGTRYNRESFEENFLSNLVSSIFLEETKADFAFINSGTFKIEWRPGDITLKNFYDMFVNDNTIMTVKTTGKDIIYIMEHIQFQEGESAKGLYGFAGATMTFDKEKRKVVKMVMSDGKEIENDKEYTLASNNWLLELYGDDMVNCKEKVDLHDPSLYGNQPETIKEYLSLKGKINVIDYYDPSKPRLLFGNYTESDEDGESDKDSESDEDSQNMINIKLKLLIGLLMALLM